MAERCGDYKLAGSAESINLALLVGLVVQQYDKIVPAGGLYCAIVCCCYEEVSVSPCLVTCS